VRRTERAGRRVGATHLAPREMVGCTHPTGAPVRTTAIHRVTVAEIETGRKQVSVATLRALAAALEVTVDDLAG